MLFFLVRHAPTHPPRPSRVPTFRPHTPSCFECITLRQGGARGERERMWRERPEREREKPPLFLNAPHTHTRTAPPSTLTAPRALQGRAEESRALEKHPAPSPMPRFFLLPSHRSSRLASSRIQPLPPFLVHPLKPGYNRQAPQQRPLRCRCK